MSGYFTNFFRVLYFDSFGHTELHFYLAGQTKAGGTELDERYSKIGLFFNLTCRYCSGNIRKIAKKPAQTTVKEGTAQILKSYNINF